MTFLRRALTGIFLMTLTVALLGYAASLMWGAVQTRMTAEPRSFPARETVVAVNVVPLTAGTIRPELLVFGEVQSRRTLSLRTSVGGTVTDIADTFVEGGRVAAGDVLLTIDPAEARAERARVAAALSEAEADERAAGRTLQLARDELAAAEAQAALREQALQRQRDLVERGVATTATLETAELAASVARETVLTRRQALAQAESEIDQTANRSELARINLDEAQRTLDGTRITAAFDGIVSGVAVTAGGRVTANEEVAQILDPAALEVSFRVSTTQYARLLDGDGRLNAAPVEVTLDVAGIGLGARGTLDRESATVGEGQTGRLVFARLDDAPGLRPGDFVTVHVAEPDLAGVALLPATALAADGTVLVVGDEDRLVAAAVDLLRRQGDDVIVRAPDLEGATIVAARTPLLGPGIRVRPIPPGGAVAEERPQTATAPPQADGDMIALDPDRRARLVAFIEGNAQMPVEAKTRLLAQIDQPEVPAEVVTRLESRMGS